jgi:hypothetical protein
MLNNYGHSFGNATLFMDNPSSITRDAAYIGTLSFWLGGFPNPDGKFAGFSADPEAPLGKEWNNSVSPPVVTRINNGRYNVNDWSYNDIELGTQDKDSVFYEMIIGKNIAYVTTTNGTATIDDDIVVPVLVNRDATVNKDGANPAPYVYFQSGSSRGGELAYNYLVSFVSNVRIYTGKDYNFSSKFSGRSYAELGIVVPYAKSGDPFLSATSPLTIWFEPERFQLIHPGLDGVFGEVNTASAATRVVVAPSAMVVGETLRAGYFRSINTNAAQNQIGQKDFDNLTNFSDYQQIKSILP